MGKGPWQGLGLGGKTQSESYLEGILGGVLGCIGKNVLKKKGWTKVGLEGFRKKYDEVISKFDFIGSTLQKESLLALLDLLVEYRDIWVDDGSGKIKRSSKVEHRIDLIEGSKPFKEAPRKTAYVED
jgi:hypothetical protein